MTVVGEYTRFKTSPIACTCGWSGLGRECQVGEVFEGGQISEYHCPECEKYLRAVPWPLIGENQSPPDQDADRAAEAKVSSPIRPRAGVTDGWEVLAQYVVVGVVLPALIFRVIFGHWDIQTEGEALIGAALGMGGFGLFMWWRSS
jgi:hypothetical protein